MVSKNGRWGGEIRSLSVGRRPAHADLTHYPELLDEFERNDNIYVTRNYDGISVENLSKILKRNAIKKSEVYQSGYLQGTVPAYESFIKFKKALIRFGDKS